MDHSALLSDCLDSVKTYKQYIDKYLEGNSKGNELERLKKITQDYCNIDHEYKKCIKVADEVAKEFENCDNTILFNNIDKLYEKKLNEDTSNITDYVTTNIWKEVFNLEDQEVTAVEAEQEKALDESQYEDLGGDDSLLASNVFTPPIDPISKTIVKNPFKNRKCGHVYEYDFVAQYIKARKRKAKCPYIGCKNPGFLNLTDLVKDDDLRKKIDAYVSQNPNQSTEED